MYALVSELNNFLYIEFRVGFETQLMETTKYISHSSNSVPTIYGPRVRDHLFT